MAGLYGVDVDSGHDAIQAVELLQSSLVHPGWVRLRGADLAKGPETRIALQKLRERGLKTCVLLRWPAPDWKHKYLPEDLREAYENGRKLGVAFGDLVDAWEVDNEPDLGFVPENAERYAAFLKAMYLGIKAGSMERGVKGGIQVSGFKSQVSQSAPLVLMGALGLPPGPWLERFVSNDGLSYTDGYNYHYYGYADDFTGVYRLHEAAVTQLSAAGYSLSGSDSINQQPSTTNLRQEKSLPIFLTEIGYGMLGKDARDTKEGRLRQWSWFKSVGEQATSLRIEAPMAFYLPPYLEYDESEFGLTATPSAQKPETGNLKPEGQDKSWVAGGIEYQASDFQVSGLKSQVSSSEQWMENIGKQIGGNEITPALAQWMAERAKNREQGETSWTVNVSEPSPVVIDFLAGEGLSFIKRYNGSFVTGLTVDKSPETSDGKKEQAPSKPATSSKQPATPPSRSEEFTIHVRTENGNLYEVYPTRQATPDWQSYSESQGNFTMSFYGRAQLPWRFRDNRPASLVVVMYPKQFPAVYEIRRLQLLQIAKAVNVENAESPMRYGHGKIVLYNFSDREVTGRLTLPALMEQADANNFAATPPNAESSALALRPGERREIPVVIKMPWNRFERIEAPVGFVFEDPAIPSAHFLTVFMPDIGGMKSTMIAELLPGFGSGSEGLETNRSLIATRKRATEEAPLIESDGLFAQRGAKIERTSDGFAVTVTARAPGEVQRIEAEISWPERLVFAEDEFLNLEYRLRPEEGK